MGDFDWNSIFSGVSGMDTSMGGVQLDPNLPANFWDQPSLYEGFTGNGSIDVGGSGLGGLGGMLTSFLSNPKNLAGLAATGLGAAAGSQGGMGGGSGNMMDERLSPYIYGGGGVIPRAQGMMDNQIQAATDQGASMIGKGASLMGQPVAGNGFGQVQLNSPNTPTNPYLSGMADDMQRRTQDMLGQSFNQIRGNSVGVGGLGGSRQGVAEGQAMKGAADSLQGNLAGLYGNAYSGDQNRALQQYGQDQSFYSTNRGQDLAGAQLGGNLLQSGFETQWAPLQQANSLMKPYSGMQSASAGSGWQGLLGGAMTGASLAGKAGLWG